MATEITAVQLYPKIKQEILLDCEHYFVLYFSKCFFVPFNLYLASI